MVRLGAAASVLVLLLVTPVAAASSCPNADADPSGAPAVELEAAVRCLVNHHRAQAGQRLLVADEQTAGPARAHASDMVARGYFAHSSPEGRTVGDRLRAVGWFAGQANWSYGETLNTGSHWLGTPRVAVDNWMASPPHRAVLLDASARLVGVGVAPGTPTTEPSGGTYVLVNGARTAAGPQTGPESPPPAPSGAPAASEPRPAAPSGPSAPGGQTRVEMVMVQRPPSAAAKGAPAAKRPAVRRRRCRPSQRRVVWRLRSGRQMVRCVARRGR